MSLGLAKDVPQLRFGARQHIRSLRPRWLGSTFRAYGTRLVEYLYWLLWGLRSRRFRRAFQFRWTWFWWRWTGSGSSNLSNPANSAPHTNHREDRQDDV